MPMKTQVDIEVLEKWNWIFLSWFRACYKEVSSYELNILYPRPGSIQQNQNLQKCKDIG